MLRDDRSRARRFHFTIRSLLIVGVILSLVLGWWNERRANVTFSQRSRKVENENRGLEKLLKYYSQRQRLAVERVRELGGRPQLTTATGLVVASPKDEQFVKVPYVDLSSPTLDGAAIHSMIPYLKDLIPSENEPDKYYVALELAGNPNVDERLIAELRNLPNCEFSKYWSVPEEVMKSVQIGMEQEQVVNTVASLVDAPGRWIGSKRRLGLPSQTYNAASGCESWAYYTDEAGVGLFGLDFDANGKVIRTWTGRGMPAPERKLSLRPESQSYR